MGFVSANQVTIGYAAVSREDALHYLSEQAVELGFADDASAVEAAFIARENEAETGLVAGFAVPHAKSDAIHTPGVAVLKLSEPVEWPSFDGVPVDVALALYVPAGEAGTTHLRLLSKAAVMLMDAGFRDKVRTSADPADISISRKAMSNFTSLLSSENIPVRRFRMVGKFVISTGTSRSSRALAIQPAKKDLPVPTSPNRSRPVLFLYASFQFST